MIRKIKSYIYRVSSYSLGLGVVLYFLLDVAKDYIPASYFEPTKKVMFWSLIVGVIRGLKYLPKNSTIIKKLTKSKLETYDKENQHPENT